MGSPLGNVFSTVTGTYIGTKLVKRVNNTTWNILWNKRCLCELTGKNSGAVQTCNHRSSRHTPLVVAMATDVVSWHHWNQGGISNKGELIPNNFWKEEICLNIYSKLSTMSCKLKGKGSGKKNTRCMYSNFQWINQLHCNLTILSQKLHLCWTSLVFSDIFQKCDRGQSVQQATQGSWKKEQGLLWFRFRIMLFTYLFHTRNVYSITKGIKKKKAWVTL